jgi:hypothetical protein
MKTPRAIPWLEGTPLSIPSIIPEIMFHDVLRGRIKKRRKKWATKPVTHCNYL